MVSTPYFLKFTTSLKTAPKVGTVGRMYIPKTGWGWGASGCPGSAWGSTSCHVLNWMNSSYNFSSVSVQKPTWTFSVNIVKLNSLYRMLEKRILLNGKSKFWEYFSSSSWDFLAWKSLLFTRIFKRLKHCGGTKELTDKLDFIQIKNFCIAKDSVKRTKS